MTPAFTAIFASPFQAWAAQTIAVSGRVVGNPPTRSVQDFSVYKSQAAKSAPIEDDEVVDVPTLLGHKFWIIMWSRHNIQRPVIRP
jgi:hypothetical protein